jgi:PAS domain S-box-containing protein
MNFLLFLKALLYKFNLVPPVTHNQMSVCDFNTRLGCLLDEKIKLEKSNSEITAKIKAISFNIVKNLSDEDDLKSVVQIIENNSSEGFITFESTGVIQAVNKAAMEMFNYTLHEFAFVNIFDILPLIHLEDSDRRELSALTKDMKKFPVEVKIEHLNEHNRFMVVISNISERKDLIEMNTFIKSVFHNSENPMYHKDKHFNYVGCNKKFEELCGKHSTEIIGRSSYELFPYDVADYSTKKEIELINDKTNNTKTYNCSIHTFLNPDRKSILVVNNLIMDNAGNNNGVIGTIIDLTDQLYPKKDESEFSMLFNDIILPIVITDNNGFIVFSNQSFGNIVGYHSNDIDNFNICTFLSNITTNKVSVISKDKTMKEYFLKNIQLPSLNKNLSIYIFSEGE